MHQRERSSAKIALVAVAITAVTLLVYWPALHGGFLWDDDRYVTHNYLLTAADGLRRIWFSLDAPSQYFPLTYTVLRIERLLWGLNPAGFHWVNLLLHVANALLVWRVLSRLNIPASWFAAAIFALHPIQVESVAWISERKDVLSTFFWMLTVCAYVDHVRKPSPRRYAIVVVAYVAALLSKKGLAPS